MRTSYYPLSGQCRMLGSEVSDANWLDSGFRQEEAPGVGLPESAVTGATAITIQCGIRFANGRNACNGLSRENHF